MFAGNASDELRFRSRRPAFNGISLFGVCPPLTQKLAPRIPSISRLACVRTAKYFNRGRSRAIRALPDANYVSFKLQAVPMSPDSQVYSLSVPYYYTMGTPERWILFRKNLEKILTGQNITTSSPPTTYAIITRQILKGGALAKFEESTAVQGTETLEHFTQVVDDMGAYIFSRRVLQMEKCDMR
jgi:hypothetical protein